MKNMNPSGPACSYEFILEWAKKAKVNCSEQGRNDAAALWGNCIEWLEYLKAENETLKAKK